MNRILKIITLEVIIALTLPVTAYKSANDCLIVVGVASKDFKCSNGNDTVGFPSHAGYQAMYHNNADNYYNTVNYIRALLRDKYNIADKNIIMYSSDKSTCVIISYRQQLKDWNCTVVKCAVGFGNNKDAALADAVAQKNEAVGTKVPYLEMNTLNCPK